MPRKKRKIDEMEQTHGVVVGKELSTLEEIMAAGRNSNYDTEDAEEYERQIRSMPRVDLERHATRQGIIPVDSKERLCKTLVKQFKMSKSSTLKQKTLRQKNNDKVLDPKFQKIMARGR